MFPSFARCWLCDRMLGYIKPPAYGATAPGGPDEWTATTAKLRAIMIITLVGSGLSNVMKTVPVGSFDPSVNLWKRSTFIAPRRGVCREDLRLFLRGARRIWFLFYRWRIFGGLRSEVYWLHSLFVGKHFVVGNRLEKWRGLRHGEFRSVLGHQLY